jgi:hypothetical protein
MNLNITLPKLVPSEDRSETAVQCCTAIAMVKRCSEPPFRHVALLLIWFYTNSKSDGYIAKKKTEFSTGSHESVHKLWYIICDFYPRYSDSLLLVSQYHEMDVYLLRHSLSSSCLSTVITLLY